MRHLRLGWWSMLAFVTLGIGLEALHALKSAAYLGVGNETRRFMWTLAHAHGVGLSLVQLGFGVTVRTLLPPLTPLLRRAGHLLTWGSLFVPLGFFLGGLTLHGGDPGIGVVLVPPGAVAIWLAVLHTAQTVHRLR